MATDQALTVAVVAGDPGGANALRPVITKMLEAGIQCRLYAYAQAQSLWAQWPLKSAEIPDLAGVDVVLTGTSVNDQMFELKWIAAARREKIPSVALIDFWSNYAERFRLLGASAAGDAIWPDWIAVPDEQAKVEASAICQPIRGIVVVGYTNGDLLINTPQLAKSDKLTIRAACGLKDNEILLVYVSQPLRSLSEQMGQASTLDEQQVLIEIEQVLQKLDLPIALRVRLHPRESVDAYPNLGRIWPHSKLELTQSAYDLLQAADVVVGISSMLLLEACYLGCKVVSYLPGQVEDCLPSNRLGWSQLCRSQEALALAIKNFISGQLIMQRPVVHINASHTIIDHIKQMARIAQQ